MCQECNDALSTAADAALKLAQAASLLYDINDHKNSGILSNAAGELFKVEKEEPVKAKASGTDGETGKPGAEAAQAEALEELRKVLPQSFEIDDKGQLHINGVAVGRAFLVRR